MPSFPLISELPLLVDTTHWTWERFSSPAAHSRNFWLGIDRNGNRWLTKLRGAFYAYREIVFARLAQAMGWSCQSTVFARLDSQSAQTLGVSAGEVHAAHWFLDEHPSQPCTHTCALTFLIGKSIQTLDDLRGSDIAHLLDWPKSDFAAYLFGGNEPPGRLITVGHEFVIIDSETMFSAEPSSFETAQWWNLPNGSPSIIGRALAHEVCCELTSLSDDEIENTLRIPEGIVIRKPWAIAPILRKSRKSAAQFCAT